MPFKVRDRLVPVQQGPVLLLNGDQPLVQLKEQLEDVDYPMTNNTKIQIDWQLQWYAQFKMLMDQHKPKLVVIDSLIGCSGGRAFDENKSEFAQPLYWLTRNNGVLFPATTILIIHHANKNGGFRGTSAIRDAVDETWSLSKPSEEEIAKVGRHSRLITIEKSRSGRSGSQLIMKLTENLTFEIGDHTPEVDKTSTSPASVSDRVLNKLRTVHPASRTTEELVHDPLIAGKPDAIRKSLQRLHKRGLIEATDETLQSKNNQSVQSYRAILASSHVRGPVMDVPPRPHSNPGA